MVNLVKAPAVFVPLKALAFGGIEEPAVPIDAAHPLPTAIYDPFGWQYYYTLNHGYTGYASPSDLLTLTCPAGKKIEILSAILSGNATAATLIEIEFLIRSAANAGGTSTAPAALKYDSTDPDSDAALALYSAVPSALGALGRTAAITKASIPAATSAAGTFNLLSTTTAQANMLTMPVKIALNPGELFAINHARSALPAGFNAQLSVMWRERDL